jgi:hypothetical protein
MCSNDDPNILKKIKIVWSNKDSKIKGHMCLDWILNGIGFEKHLGGEGREGKPAFKNRVLNRGFVALNYNLNHPKQN